MKETYYFSHDYTPLDDPKLSAFVGKYGAIGYGIFWRIVELLHQEETHKLPHKDYIFHSLSNTMKVDFDDVKIMIDYAINQCELFKSDSNFFYSERVIRNMKKREHVSQARSESGKKGRAMQILSQTSAEQVRANAEQMPTSAEQVRANLGKGKERKGKEIKENENKINKEEKEISFNFKKSLIDYGFSENLVTDWLKVRKAKKGVNTETAFNDFVTEVEKSGYDKNKLLEFIICKNWVGFFANWITDNPQTFYQLEPKHDQQPKPKPKQLPISKLLRRDFETNAKYLLEIKRRGEFPDIFDFSLSQDLREGKSEETILIEEHEMKLKHPKGLNYEGF